MSKTLIKNWLSGDSNSDGEENFQDRFSKEEFEGDKGHLRLQLQKTYKGDDRFKLDKNFTVETRSKHHLPDDLYGSLSKLERERLFKEKQNKKQQINEYDSDAENRVWDIDLNLAKEKSQAFDILAKIVPQSEIYLSSKPCVQKQSSQRQIVE